MGAWKCRLCGFDRYHQVSVIRKNGTKYQTSFLACSGCSVMFLNATTFNCWHPVSTETATIAFPPVVTPLRRRL
jgi:hypothetical protein